MFLFVLVTYFMNYDMGQVYFHCPCSTLCFFLIDMYENKHDLSPVKQQSELLLKSTRTLGLQVFRDTFLTYKILKFC